MSHIGSFVQVHIRTHCSNLVRIDLQAALQRSIQTLHLPVHQLPDELVKMKVFVPQGVTCFSSETFDCTSPFENWQKALTDEGRRVYPRKNPDTMIFHRVHKSIEEICPVFEPSVKHFILGDTDEQAHIRTVIFALFTARYEFICACHWTPITKVWDILDLCGGDHGWIIYHNNRRLSHRNVEVDQGDFFACYERSNSVEAESQQGVVVWSSTQKCPPSIPNAYPLRLTVLPGEELQRHLPETLQVEATGLGGRDLVYPFPWDISIRSDNEGQSIYGPSLALMEEKVDVPGLFGGTESVQLTALGRSKASNEFLVLHYFGLDSAKHWDALLTEVLPAVRLPGASARRASAVGMFEDSHIAPSHRRMAHVLWTDSMTFDLDPLDGGQNGALYWLP